MKEDFKKNLYFHDCKLTVLGKYHNPPYKTESIYNNLFIILGDHIEFLSCGRTIFPQRGDSVIFPCGTQFVLSDVIDSSLLQISFTLEKNNYGNVCLYDYLNSCLSEIIVLSGMEYNDIFLNDYDFENNIELMKYIINAANSINSAGHSSKKLSQLILNFIKLNYPIHITSKLLEDTFNMRYSKLFEIFKKDMGMSINCKLKEIRIDTAKRLLSQTNIPISEIAFKVGYENEYYFSTLFKNTTSLSPSKYRKTKHKRSEHADESSN